VVVHDAVEGVDHRLHAPRQAVAVRGHGTPAAYTTYRYAPLTRGPERGDPG